MTLDTFAVEAKRCETVTFLSARSTLRQEAFVLRFLSVIDALLFPALPCLALSIAIAFNTFVELG